MTIRRWLGSQLREPSCGFTVTLLFFAILAAPALCAPAPSEWRVIVLKGAQMPQLLGAAENRLEVLALHQGHFEPIPFQVDEVLPDGNYALSDGPEPVVDDSPGILDRDDEIAIMFSDLSERAGQRERLPFKAYEVSALDPVSGVRRYAYVAAVSSPRLSPVSYMSYDPATGQINGTSYRITFRNDYPVGLALKNARDGWSPNLITGAEVRVTARVLMFFTLHLGANGVNNRVLAWHTGPIRVIRRVSHSVNLMFGIRSPRVVSSETFYRDYSEDSFVARVLWVPRVFFGDVRVRSWLDFTGIDGFMLLWSGRDEPRLVIGSADVNGIAKLQRDPPHVQWIALRGEGKLVMQTFMPSTDLAVIRPQLYYCDGTLDAEVAARCTRATHQIGYLMTGWENLPAGTHRLESVLLVVPDDNNPGHVMRKLAAPLIVKVRDIPR